MPDLPNNQALPSDVDAQTLFNAMLAALTASLAPFAPRKVVIALSGGLDSMLLLELLTRIPGTFQRQAAYVDHGLSVNAKAWGQFCQQQCQQRQVDCYLVPVHIAERQRNIEAQARTARYAALAKFIDEPHQLLLTAHHADDQTETLLLALKRGSGLDGLTGIAKQKAFHAGFLVRPLLPFSRAELAIVANWLGITWIEDESNQNLDFDRNFIRQQILPLLQQRFERFSQNASRSASLLQDAQQWQQQQLEPCLAAMVEAERLNLSELAQVDTISQRLLLRAFLKQHDLLCSQLQLENLRQQLITAKADAKIAINFAGKSLRRFQQFLYVVAREDNELEPLLSGQPAIGHALDNSLSAHTLTWQQPLEISGLWFYWTDEPSLVAQSWPLAQLPDAQLTVQKAVMSQRFKPAGALTKPLKQWCQLWQIPPWQRQQLAVVVAKEQVVVVLGQASATPEQQAKSWLHVYSEFPHSLIHSASYQD